jgi:hypothetical protein
MGRMGKPKLVRRHLSIQPISPILPIPPYSTLSTVTCDGNAGDRYTRCVCAW